MVVEPATFGIFGSWGALLMSHILRRISVTVLAVGVSFGATCPAHGAVILAMIEQGGDVILEGSGSVDLNGFSPNFSSAVSGLVVGSPATVFLGDSSLVGTDAYSVVTGPASFGVGGFALATNGSGDHFGVTSFGAGGLGLLVLHVPNNYVSRDPLSGASVYAGTTFASLGVTPGTYVWRWGHFETADSFTLQIGSTVPEPASLALLALGVSTFGVRRWRRRNGTFAPLASQEKASLQ